MIHFNALAYGNLWPFEEQFYKGKEHDITLYHGADDTWTSPDKGKIFAQETDSEFVEFWGCYHGFCKPGYDNHSVGEVIVNPQCSFFLYQQNSRSLQMELSKAKFGKT